jgi:long-subunit fatty acid transport protein
MTRRQRAVLIASVLLLARGAVASPSDLYGALPRGMATAGTQTAAADDNGAALYNPAGIALAGADGKTSVQLGFAYGQPFMFVNRSKTDAVALQKSPTQLPQGQGWYMAAATFPLGGKIRDRASLGFDLYVPQGRFVRVESLDPKEPQWIRYQNDADRLVLAAGLGIRITDWLSVGIGANMLAALTGTVNFSVDLANKKVNQRDISFDLKPGIAPAFGVTVEPLKGWRLAFAYRGALELTVGLPTNIDLGGVGVTLGINGTVLYSPQQFSFGTQYALSSQWKLAFDVKYELWSQAPFPGVQLSVAPNGDVSTMLGLDKLGFSTNDPSARFTNIVVPSISVEYAFPDSGIRLRGGYAFRPTYVPNQVGTTNYLDSDAHILGLGATFQFNDPLEVFTQPLKLDIGSQFQATQRRAVSKALQTDPVGSYDFGGVVVAASATLRYEF